MTLGGWITLILAVGGVTLWTVWCFVRVFNTKDVSHLAAETTIEPEDEREDRERSRRRKHK
jgi:hypothetical protein